MAKSGLSQQSRSSSRPAPEVLWQAPADVPEWGSWLAAGLHGRNRWRLGIVFLGMLFAGGRRIVTSWLRAAGVTADYQDYYYFLNALGRKTNLLAARLVELLFRLLPLPERLLIVIDDSPTARYGPQVEGADLHHNPTPGPSLAPFVYGHNWVTLSLAVRHPLWGTIALPLLVMDDGQPRFVTVLGTTDTRDGWRPNKPHGGCIIDVPSEEFVTRGLSMPHSPRWHDDKLWVLESGTGGVVLVDRATGQRDTVSQLPGFTRGLALCGQYAFIGLSKIRPTSAMDGVPIAARRDELKCGVAAVDLRSGRLVGLLEFQTAVEEIFDVQVLSGIRFPEVIGLQKESLHHTFIIPPENNRAETGGTAVVNSPQ